MNSTTCQEGAPSPSSVSMRDMVRRNRLGEAVGTHVVCSAPPKMLDAAIHLSRFCLISY
jgi:hypothetical protein